MKTGIIFGVFDLLHVGHIVTLEGARRQCDYLIVGLKADAHETAQDESQPAQTVIERFIKLEGCQYVDEIIPYESDNDIVDILQSLTVDVHFVGEDQSPLNFPGKEYCIQEGIELKYLKRKHRFSSHGLRNTVSQKELQKAAAFQIKRN